MSTFKIVSGGHLVRADFKPGSPELIVRRSCYPVFTTNGPLSITTRYETSMRMVWEINYAAVSGLTASCGLMKEDGGMIGGHAASLQFPSHKDVFRTWATVIAVREKTEVLNDETLSDILGHLREKSINDLSVKLKVESVTTFETQLRRHVNAYTKAMADLNGVESKAQIEDPTRISDDVKLGAIRKRVEDGEVAESDFIHQADIEDMRRALETRKGAIIKLLTAYTTIVSKFDLGYVLALNNEESTLYNLGLAGAKRDVLIEVLQSALNENLESFEKSLFGNV